MSALNKLHFTASVLERGGVEENQNQAGAVMACLENVRVAEVDGRERNA